MFQFSLLGCVHSRCKGDSLEIDAFQNVDIEGKKLFCGNGNLSGRVGMWNYFG